MSIYPPVRPSMSLHQELQCFISVQPFSATALPSSQLPLQSEVGWYCAAIVPALLPLSHVQLWNERVTGWDGDLQIPWDNKNKQKNTAGHLFLNKDSKHPEAGRGQNQITSPTYTEQMCETEKVWSQKLCVDKIYKFYTGRQRNMEQDEPEKSCSWDKGGEFTNRDKRKKTTQIKKWHQHAVMWPFCVAEIKSLLCGILCISENNVI